jgi:hypothetical protein
MALRAANKLSPQQPRVRFLKPGVNFSGHDFLLTLARDELLSQQALMAFFLEHLRPFEQCFRARFNGIAWCFEMCSGEEALTGEFVVLVSHLNLGEIF